MVLTTELRTKLRKLTDEVIPVGGSAANTRFADSDLDEIITDSATINKAAAEVWEQKTARAMSERGGLVESSAGDERFKFIDQTSYRDHCLQMAAMFSKKGGGSRIFELDPPNVLGTITPVGSFTQTGGDY